MAASCLARLYRALTDFSTGFDTMKRGDWCGAECGVVEVEGKEEVLGEVG